MPKLLSAMQFRKLCNSYLRFNSFLILFNYYKSFIKRFFNKLFFRRKKILPKKGIIIAISGVDGSGKTTMLKEINNLLSKIFTINQFHLGRPLGSILEFLWRNLGNKSKDSNMPGTINYSTSSPMGRALNSIILGFFRFLIAKKIKKKSNSGILILTDRWPTSQIGKMDGPRIIISKNSNFIIHFCKKVEQWLYNKMPKADICYVLTVPLETALERNRLRIKKNKETQKHIRARYLRNESFKPIANKTIYFENIEKMEINSRELINNIWNEIKKI